MAAKTESSASSPSAPKIGAGVTAGAIRASGKGESAGVGAQTTPRSPRRSTSTKVRNQGGVRTVKWYSVSQQELVSLAALQGMAALFAAVGTFFVGVWLSTKQGLEMAAPGDISAATKASWETVEVLCGIGAIGCGCLFVVFLGLNGLHVMKIHRDTHHD